MQWQWSSSKSETEMTLSFKKSKACQTFKGNVWHEGRFIETEFYIARGKIKEGKKGKVIESAYIIPPFTDPHIHGGWGFSFQRGEFESLERKLREQGINFAIPTLENDDLRHMARLASEFKAYRKDHPQSIFPFLRVEGPFISREKLGVQAESYVLKPEAKNIQKFLALEEIRLFTFAPELKGTEKLIAKAVRLGKIPSVGHSNASFEDFLRCHSLGVKHMTHFPNAMRGLHHRDLGLVGAGLLLDDVHLEIIADGIHTSFEFISLVLRIRGLTFSLISDLIAPAFSGKDDFEGRKILRNGRKITTSEGIIAGGSTTVAEQVRLLFTRGEKPENLVFLACLNSLDFFRLPRPSLEEGSTASFLLLDEEMKVTAVYIKGERIN